MKALLYPATATVVELDTQKPRPISVEVEEPPPPMFYLADSPDIPDTTAPWELPDDEPPPMDQRRFEFVRVEQRIQRVRAGLRTAQFLEPTAIYWEVV